MFTKATLLAALAATVSAEGLIHPGALAVKRDLVARRSAVADVTTPAMTATACLDALESIYMDIPTPPAQLESMAMTITNVCDFTVPSSLSSAYSSYESELLSWSSANSAAIDSALSECPQYTSLVATVADMCSTAVAGASATTPATLVTATASAAITGSTGSTTNSSATATGRNTTNASGTSSSSSTATSTNAGARETGFVGAVAVVAGILGVVAAL